jgi:hypothetical protein
MDEENMVNNPAQISSQLCLLTPVGDAASSVDSVAHPPSWPSRDEFCDNECSVWHVWYPTARNHCEQSHFPYKPFLRFPRPKLRDTLTLLYSDSNEATQRCRNEKTAASDTLNGRRTPRALSRQLLRILHDVANRFDHHPTE